MYMVLLSNNLTLLGLDITKDLPSLRSLGKFGQLLDLRVKSSRKKYRTNQERSSNLGRIFVVRSTKIYDPS